MWNSHAENLARQWIQVGYGEDEGCGCRNMGKPATEVPLNDHNLYRVYGAWCDNGGKFANQIERPIHIQDKLSSFQSQKVRPLLPAIVGTYHLKFQAGVVLCK